MNNEEAKDGYSLYEWVHAKAVDFDCDAVYDEKIGPLVDQVMDLCAEYNIPIIIKAVVAREGRNCTMASSVFVGSIDRAQSEILAIQMMEALDPESLSRMAKVGVAQNAKMEKGNF